MPPSRRGRSRKVGLQRIEAALDAVRPMGFPSPLVRKTIRTLLKAYGGPDGWTFIEEGSYKLLIDTILEDLETSERENNEAKLLQEGEPKLLIENGLPKYVITQDEMGTKDQSPDGYSKLVQSPRIHSPTSFDIKADPLKNEALDEKLAVKVHSPQMDSAGVHFPAKLEIVPSCSIMDKISQHKLGGQLSPTQISDVAQFSGLRLSSPVDGETLPRPRRKPCYGWLSSDDEEEPDPVYLGPAV